MARGDHARDHRQQRSDLRPFSRALRVPRYWSRDELKDHGGTTGGHGRPPERRKGPKTGRFRHSPVSGRYWARTSDLRLVEAALSQLS
jgi:hypothetical protein